jgi:hypothetical protein
MARSGLLVFRGVLHHHPTGVHPILSTQDSQQPPTSRVA